MTTTADPTTSGAQPAPAQRAQMPLRYVHSPELPQLFTRLGLSLLVSTYQAGKLMVVRSSGDRISTLLRSFEQVMGLAVDGNRLAVGTRRQVWVLRNAPDIGAQMEPVGRHDACFVPRFSHVTGDIRIHEIDWAGDELVIVNTRFSCLCKLSNDYSFVPIWRPPFITALTAEDRCHLNGLAMDHGKPRYVTALGTCDTAQGWRPGKVDGGVVIDVPSGEIVARGLSMPHSPRVHAGRVWVLNSGEGELQVLDPASGKRDTVARFPGYTRGLSFHGKYAFVALSKIREKKEFGGLPIESRIPELVCGVYVVDIESGQTAGFIRFDSGCTELFAVQVLENCRWPTVIGLEKETLNGIFVVPREQS